MNAPQTPIAPSAATQPSAPASPPDIDAIINRFLTRANEVAEDGASDPKEVCALGWLVLKIKQFQVKNDRNKKAKPGGLTPETIRLLEEKGKML